MNWSPTPLLLLLFNQSIRSVWSGLSNRATSKPIIIIIITFAFGSIDSEAENCTIISDQCSKQLTVSQRKVVSLSRYNNEANLR